MKKLNALLLIFLSFTLLSCKQTPSYQNPINLYYPRAEIEYGDSEGHLISHVVDGGELTDIQILSAYLQENSSAPFVSPFPNGTSIIHFEITNGIANITLSDAYATLNGLDLSIANACLAKTVFNLTDTQVLVIQCENQMIDGAESIQLTLEQIILFDNTRQVVSTDLSATNPPE